MSCRQHFLDPPCRLAAGALLATCLLVAVPSAQAQPGQAPKVVAYDIPAQPLEVALQQVADKASLQLLYSPADLKGVSTRGLKGAHTPKEAIDRLIEGTGLTASFNGQNAVAIKPKAANERGGQAANPTLLAQAPTAERRGPSSSPDQTASSDQRAVRGEGIIVTAQKRDELLMDVPASIAVVTKEDIERRGLVNAEDYLRGIAGVNQVEGFTGQSITIRGIESSLYYQNFFTGTTVATYFGETPTTNTAGTGGGTNVDIKLVDIDRVEVLRGPQGTAFGSSSMGGTVRTIPVAPKLDRFEGRVAGGYSVTAGYGGENYNGQAVLNLPLMTDMLAIRVVGYGFHDSGFYRNRSTTNADFQSAVVVPTGSQAFVVDRDDIGAYAVIGGRVAALLRPSRDLQLTLNYLSQKNERDGFPVANSGTYEQAALQVAVQNRGRGQDLGRTDMNVDIANAVVEYNFGWANLLATYSNTKSGAEIAFPHTAALGSTSAWSQNGFSDHRENVGEIRLVSQLDGPWNFLGGIYVESLKDNATFDNIWYGPLGNPFGTNPAIGLRDDRRTLKQRAAFGEASWEFAPALTLTGGVRAYRFDRTFLVNTIGRAYNGVALENTTVTTARATDASGQTYRANLSYKPADNALLYGAVSQGFRLGQLQFGLPPGSCDVNGDGIVDGTSTTIEATRRINSDKVNSYELGGKIDLLDRRLSISADVFHMDWNGFPIQVASGSLVATCVLTYLANAGRALSDGIEFQATYQIAKGFRVDFSGSWINARLDEDVPALRAAKGNRLPGSPKVNAQLGVQYEFAFGGYKPYVRADAVYVGSFFGDLLETPTTKAGGYVKLDASAGVKVGNFNVDLFVRNATNEDAFTFRNASTGSAPARVAEFFGYRLRPRTVGFQIAYVF